MAASNLNRVALTRASQDPSRRNSTGACCSPVPGAILRACLTTST